MLNPTLTPVKLNGECEVCAKQVDKIFLHHNIWFCDECWRKEEKAIAINQQEIQVSEMIAKAKDIDQTIQVDRDLYNAATVPAIELKKLIMADDSIPATEKEYRYAKATEERFLTMRKAIFDEEQALLVKKNEMRMWQAQTVETCAKLSAKYRAEFKDLNINYDVKPPKTAKPPKEKAPKDVFKLTEVKAAAEKYKVDVTVIRMTAMQYHLSAENAAIHASNKMQKKACDCPVCKKAS